MNMRSSKGDSFANLSILSHRDFPLTEKFQSKGKIPFESDRKVSVKGIYIESERFSVNVCDRKGISGRSAADSFHSHYRAFDSVSFKGGDRFMISATQYNKIYDQHCQVLKAEAKRIADSSAARAWLNKNVGKTDPTECLEVALRCIYDLTGDETMLINAQKIKEEK